MPNSALKRTGSSAVTVITDRTVYTTYVYSLFTVVWNIGVINRPQKCGG